MNSARQADRALHRRDRPGLNKAQQDAFPRSSGDRDVIGATTEDPSSTSTWPFSSAAAYSSSESRSRRDRGGSSRGALRLRTRFRRARPHRRTTTPYRPLARSPTARGSRSMALRPPSTRLNRDRHITRDLAVEGRTTTSDWAGEGHYKITPSAFTRACGTAIRRAALYWLADARCRGMTRATSPGAWSVWRWRTSAWRTRARAQRDARGV